MNDASIIFFWKIVMARLSFSCVTSNIGDYLRTQFYLYREGAKINVRGFIWSLFRIKMPAYL
uniref:Uncharacterized protein n=1 Tax=Rhizophora mucronata TaxID=61149 RepID=A0A2P2QUB9_RHIMU